MKILPLFVLGAFLAPSLVFATTPEHVIGRILLQVEGNGEAWYVSPVSEERTYLENGAAAFAILRQEGLGITNENLSKIPVGIETRFEEVDTDGDELSDFLEESLGTDTAVADSDGDGFNDSIEVLNGYDPLGSGTMSIDTSFASSLSGRILLQVESRGEAWYVNPDDGHRYYMNNGEAAYEIMRYLSLGITNVDLEQIPIYVPPAQVPSDLAMFIEISDTTYDHGEALDDLTMGISYGGEAFEGMVIYRYAREGVAQHYIERVVGTIEDVSFEEMRGEEFMNDLSGTAFSIADDGAFSTQSTFDEIDAYGVAIQVTSCERMEEYFSKLCADITAEDLMGSLDYPVDMSKGQGFFVKDPSVSDSDWSDAYYETHPSGRMDWFFDEIE